MFLSIFIYKNLEDYFLNFTLKSVSISFDDFFLLKCNRSSEIKQKLEISTYICVYLCFYLFFTIRNKHTHIKANLCAARLK